MSSIREQILVATIAALNTGTPSTVPNAQRERINPIEPGVLPVMVVSFDSETVERIGGNRGPSVSRVLTLEIDCYSIGDSSVLDEQLVWITKTLIDSTLGSLVTMIHETGTVWERSELDRDYVRAQMTIDVTYKTAAADQEAI